MRNEACVTPMQNAGRAVGLRKVEMKTFRSVRLARVLQREDSPEQDRHALQVHCILYTVCSLDLSKSGMSPER